MKRIVAVALAAVLATGCSSAATKNFKVIADPPDADIRVISGRDLKEQTYRSPAAVTIEVPSDPALAAKAILEVQRENYQPKVIALKDIRPGETLTIQLEQIIQKAAMYSLRYRMRAPAVSSELRFRDGVISVTFSIAEQMFNMRFENLTDREVKILWDQSEYSDVNSQPHRIMPSTVHFPDRNNPLPEQIVPAKSSIQEDVIPVSNVFLSRDRKGYYVHALFPLDSDAAAGLKGKSFSLFIPVGVDRVIIPYNFKIEITDAVKETVKN